MFLQILSNKENTITTTTDNEANLAKYLLFIRLVSDKYSFI